MGTTKLYIGLNDKDTKKQEITAAQARKKIIDIVIKYFTGFSFEIIDGVYEHDDGTVVIENTVVITICTDDDLLGIGNMIEELKYELNQECIMIEKYASMIRFI